MCIEAVEHNFPASALAPARRRNALVTSVQLNFPVARELMKFSVNNSVISISRGESNPRGIVVTSRGGSRGTSDMGGLIWANVLSR